MNSFGEKLWDELTAFSKRAGRKCDKADFVQIGNALAQSEGVLRKKKPRGAARARNPLFDALALATGIKNLSEITRDAAKKIGIALADILEVCPDLTTEEINRRAAAYVKRYPEARNLSAGALAKHWAQFGQGAKTKAGANDVYQEPENWHAAAIVLFGFDAGTALGTAGWFNIGIDYRTKILAEIRALNRV